MSRGIFYVQPPTFIGGRQPYAPRNIIPQSGETPQAPPLRGPMALATLALVVSAWTPPPAQAQTAPKIAPLISTPAAQTFVPYSRYSQQRVIADSWEEYELEVITLNRGATLPIVSEPPPRPHINISALADAWSQQWSTQRRPFVASLPIVNDPPQRSLVNFNTTLQAWVPPFVASQGYSRFAPLAPTVAGPDAPPVPSRVNDGVVVLAWTPPWMPPQGFARIAPVLPRVDAPPASSTVNLNTIHASWIPPYVEVQGYAQLVIERIDAPPALTRTNFDTIARQWEPRWTGPEQVKFAPNAPTPPIPDPPPQMGRQNLSVVLSQWEVTYDIPRPATIASIAPPSAALPPLTRIVMLVNGRRVVVLDESSRILRL